MPRLVVVLSGAVSSGKTTLADNLADRYGIHPIRTKDILVAQLREGDRPTRDRLQRLGDSLDRRTHGAWVADAVVRDAADLPDDAVVLVDSVRRPDQIEGLRLGFGRQVIHVHLTAPADALEERYRRRSAGDARELSSYAAVRANRTEARIEQLARVADVVIDTARCTPTDVVVRAATHLGLTSRDTGAFVDVIIGGQYGSEGKGHLAYHIAPEYDYLVRVGGPNAGHQVIWPDGSIYTHRLLPSGTLANANAKLVIGPGAVLNIDLLLQEIAECGVEADRLVIDPQAMIIAKRDVTREERLKRAIGSTGQGGGAATIRRIARGGDVKLARDNKALRPYVREVAQVIEDAFACGGRMLLEGTQGTALSLYHGDYPYVTSRDTSVAGCLSEAGLPPKAVRKVIMVCRTFPIRVKSPDGSTSGPMAQEVPWSEVAERAGVPEEQLTSIEKGSVSGNLRRVAEFDWAWLRRAAVLNGPTDIGLTFVDYLSPTNEKARRFEQLTDDTIRFIDEVERVAGAPVTLISTRFHARSIIDRRSW